MSRINENDVLLQRKNQNGDDDIMYPVTRVDNLLSSSRAGGVNAQHGFWITNAGFALIAKWGAGAPRIIDSVWVGSGVLPGGTDPRTLTGLVNLVATATTNTPITENNQIQFIVEYRNDLHPAQDGFWLNEYGIFAIDPDAGRILLAIGLLEHPEWVPPLTGGLAVRRYPVSIGVSGDANITLSFPANAFVTDEQARRLILEVAPGLTNPNILTNPDFRHPINTTTDTIFTINNWEHDPEISAEIVDEGSARTKRGMLIKRSLTPHANLRHMFQSWGHVTMPQELLFGKTLTLSVEDGDGNIYCGCVTVPDTFTSGNRTWGVVNTPFGALELGFGGSFMFFGISPALGGEVVITRAKLELGQISTLKNDPPPNPNTNFLKTTGASPLAHERLIGGTGIIATTPQGGYQQISLGAINFGGQGANAKRDIIIPLPSGGIIAGYVELEIASYFEQIQASGAITKKFNLFVHQGAAAPIINFQESSFPFVSRHLDGAIGISDMRVRNNMLVITIAARNEAAARVNQTYLLGLKMFSRTWHVNAAVRLRDVAISDVYTDDLTVYPRAGALQWHNLTPTNGITTTLHPLRIAQIGTSGQAVIQGLIVLNTLNEINTSSAWIPDGLRPAVITTFSMASNDVINVTRAATIREDGTLQFRAGAAPDVAHNRYWFNVVFPIAR